MIPLKTFSLLTSAGQRHSAARDCRAFQVPMATRIWSTKPQLLPSPIPPPYPYPNVESTKQVPQPSLTLPVPSNAASRKNTVCLPQPQILTADTWDGTTPNSNPSFADSHLCWHCRPQGPCTHEHIHAPYNPYACKILTADTTARATVICITFPRPCLHISNGWGDRGRNSLMLRSMGAPAA